MMEESTKSSSNESEELDAVESIVGRTVLFLMAGLFRSLDLFVLLFKPSLIRPYVSLWRAQYVSSPYRWPRSYRTVHALKAADQKMGELLYGETPLVMAVWIFRRAGVGPAVKFIDLCAGRGRALLAASFLGADARGVELAHERVEMGQQALAKVGAELEAGDGATTDLEPFDVVYLDWTGLEPATRLRFLDTLKSARVGARVVTLSAAIDDPSYRLISNTTVFATWGPVSVWIHERVRTDN